MPEDKKVAGEKFIPPKPTSGGKAKIPESSVDNSKSGSDQKLKTEEKPKEERKETTTPPNPLNQKKKEGKESKVEVDQSVLEALVKKVEDQAKSIEMLTFTADKSRLAQWDAKHKGDLIRSANITVWHGKYVVGWEAVQDEVSIINGVLREKQIIRLYLHEGDGKDLKTEEMDYLHFYRNKEVKSGNIVKRSQTTDGDTFTLQFEDGKKLEIDIKFIN